MTRLFIRFYVGVLAVLFMAWYIHGAVLKRRADADRARVFEEAHGGGARLVARELSVSPPEQRERTLESLRKRFAYPVDVIPWQELPGSLQRRLSRGSDVAFYRPQGKSPTVVATLSSGAEVVRLGPFPSYDLAEIEDSLSGWMRLAADRLDSATLDQRLVALRQLREQFYFPIDIVSDAVLPEGHKRRLRAGEDVVFFEQEEDRWFAATLLPNSAEVVRFGPFPSFQQIEQKAATTTLALVLLPAALAIALLLRPVTRQLRYVERAATAIASGDLSARVDEDRVNSAKSLAHSFNHMASRTESLVRTQRELLQAVSHELRTPLSRMRFAIDLVATAKDDQERAQRLQSLDAATEELDQLVGELLSYVRMETTAPRLDREQIALQDALDVVIPKLSSLHPSIKFDATAIKDGENDGDTEDVVFADRVALQRVLGNLLGNAGRFAKSQVKITTEPCNGTMAIDVDDDGRGIPASDRERVLEPFVRLDGNTNSQGVGLGLALVKRIVTQHGGSVEVLASPLGGCRVRTKWPRA